MLYLNEKEQALLDALCQVQQRRLVPKRCLVCATPIEQSWGGGHTRRFCNKAGCRKAASRLMRRVERDRWEDATRQRLRAYWQELLPDSRSSLEDLLQSRWITTEVDEGAYHHRTVDIADCITRIIDAERRAAWRQMERYTVVLEQRAEKAEAHEAALQEELKTLRQLLPGAFHDEIERQPRYVNVIDAAPSPRVVTIAPVAAERDNDDARTYAILAQAGIKPTAQALAEQEEDDPEGYEGDEEEE